MKMALQLFSFVRTVVGLWNRPKQVVYTGCECCDARIRTAVQRGHGLRRAPVSGAGARPN